MERDFHSRFGIDLSADKHHSQPPASARDNAITAGEHDAHGLGMDHDEVQHAGRMAGEHHDRQTAEAAGFAENAPTYAGEHDGHSRTDAAGRTHTITPDSDTREGHTHSLHVKSKTGTPLHSSTHPSMEAAVKASKREEARRSKPAAAPTEDARRAPGGDIHESHSTDEGKTWSDMKGIGLPGVMPFCTIVPIEGGKKLLSIKIKSVI